MGFAQRWSLALVGLGALYLVVVNPNGFYKAVTGVRSLAAGSVVDITTGGKGNPNYNPNG